MTGTDKNRQKYGIWENDTWGTYNLCVFSSCDLGIVITTGDGVIVFNYESDSTTSSLYEYLRGEVPEF